MKETKIQWHSAFVSAMGLDLEKNRADLIFEKESFELLQDILEEAGELTERVPYEDLVITKAAEKSAK